MFLFGRWLVLTFKREFSFPDALTMFEIISSQHLELSSMEAERERERQRARELERDGKRIDDMEALNFVFLIQSEKPRAETSWHAVIPRQCPQVMHRGDYSEGIYRYSISSSAATTCKCIF